MKPCIVADLGGTFLRCGLVYEDDSITTLERTRLPHDVLLRNKVIWVEIIEAIVQYARRQSENISMATPIALAFPGPLSQEKIPISAPTVITTSSLIPDIRALIAERTGRDVFILNDVSAAAWYFDKRVAADRFVVVTVSSGIGAKIFDRRHPLGVLDDVAAAGEIGHLIVDHHREAPICDCGGYGHLGALASARGFERSARIAAALDIDGFSHSANATLFGAEPETLSNEAHLVPALRLGDAWSIELLRTAIRPLANVLKTLCVGSGLDGIAVMGGFAQALGELYRSLLESAVGMLSDCGPARNGLRSGIVLADANEEPSLVGAAAYARRAGRYL